MTPEEYKKLSVKEFTQAAKIYDSGHAGIYEMCKDDYPPILAELEKEDLYIKIDLKPALSKEQLAKLNKKDILQLLLESMEQEKELRSQLAVLTDELKRTNQQMQVILEKWNLAQATRFGRSSEKMTYDTGACQQLELAIMYAECFNEAEACFLRQILLITPSFAYNRIQYE